MQVCVIMHDVFNNFITLYLVNISTSPLLDIDRYVPLNRVWFSGSCALNGVYNFTIQRLEQGALECECRL